MSNPNPDPLSPNEKHNKHKDQIIDIFREYFIKTTDDDSELINFIILLETLICSGLFLITKDQTIQLEFLDILTEATKERLEEIHQKRKNS